MRADELSAKLRAKLFSERPDLREFIDPNGSLDSGSPPDETGSSMKAKKKDVLSEDEIRKMFAPRPLRDESADFSAGTVGIVRAVKKKSLAGDSEREAKDFIVDLDRGVIGSQG